MLFDGQGLAELSKAVDRVDALTADNAIADERGRRLERELAAMGEELNQAAVEQEQAVADRDERIADLVAQLEEVFDASAEEQEPPTPMALGEIPSGDELAAELQEFLQQRPEED